MNGVLPADSAAFLWLEARTGCVLTRDARGLCHRNRAGMVRGVVAYDYWTEAACQVHFAFASPIALRHLLKPGFRYPFLETNRQLLLGFIRESNGHSVKLAKHLGFKLGRHIQDGWAPGEALLLLEMRRRDCRWLEA